MDTILHSTHSLRSMQPLILDAANPLPVTVSSLRTWTVRCSDVASQSFEKCREVNLCCADATLFLRIASRRIHHYIRNDLSVPFLRTKDLIGISSGSALDRGTYPPSQDDSSEKDSLRPNWERKCKRCDNKEARHAPEIGNPASCADGCELNHLEDHCCSSGHGPEKRFKASCPGNHGKERN